MSENKAEYSSVIVGGGLVGASLALALSTAGQKVAVVEAHPPGKPGQPSFDDRATALSNGSRRVFEALGVWPLLAPYATAIRSIHVSDQGRFGISRIEAQREGVQALGFMVRNRHIGEGLMARLRAAKSIDLLAPATVSGIEFSPNAVQVLLDASGDQTLSCSLLIAADGARSSVCRYLGIESERQSYGQIALVTNIATERDLHGVAYERFTEDGPLAILPMSDEDAPAAGGRATIVWSVPEALAPELVALQDQEFCARLQAAFGFRLGHIQRVGRRVSYPLALVQSKEQVRERLAVVGNAAHSLHPVAGQGFNLSLRDVAALAETLVEATRIGQDPGSLEVLERYVAWRARDQRDVVRFSDGLLKVFGSASPIARAGRNLGLIALELLPGAKTLVARQTMGVAGRLPRLARGLSLQ